MKRKNANEKPRKDGERSKIRSVKGHEKELRTREVEIRKKRGRSREEDSK